MDISTLGLARNCLPNVPNLIKTTALSIIGCSSNSKHQDTLTEAIVTASRPILQTPASIQQAQLSCNTDWGIGRPWISKYTVPAPSDSSSGRPAQSASSISSYSSSSPSSSPSSGADPAQISLSATRAVEFAIGVLDRRPTNARQSCPIPELIDVETEWTFYKPMSLPISALASSSNEQQIYDSFMRHADSSGPTVLHFHGGAFCLMDPSTHRWTTSALAKHSHGRVLSVRYRLSPQNVFPAALLDALQVYLALLAPPPHAFHTPVVPSSIVISGDSSGGCLASSLSLLLITLARHNISIPFHGTHVKIPSPPCAGVSLVSPWLDLTRSLPSTIHNARWDIIAPPPIDAASPPFPPDGIWPTSPPRSDTYTTADMVTHPLVSPVAAQPGDWSGSPPLYICCGWEGFADEIEILARRVYQSSNDAIVRFQGWQGMPHCFQMVPWNRAGREAMLHWGTFCSQAVTKTTTTMTGQERENNGSNHLVRTTFGTWTSSKTYISHDIKLDDLGMLTDGSCGYVREQKLDDDVVDAMFEKGRAWRIGLENELVRRWKEKTMAE